MSDTVDTSILTTFTSESVATDSNGLLGKLKIGSNIYEVKDIIARTAINAIINGDETVAGSIENKVYNKAKDAIYDYDASTHVVTIGAAITDLQNQIDAAANGAFLVVEALPTSDIKQKVIYLVPKTAPVSDGGRGAPAGTPGYVEWVYLNTGTSQEPDYSWEEIGDTDIDLSDYATSAEVSTAFANLKATLEAELATEVASLTADINALDTSTTNAIAALDTSTTSAINTLDTSVNVAIGEWSDSSIFADTSLRAAIEGVYDAIAGQSTDTFVSSVALDNTWDAGSVSDLAMDTTDSEMVVFTKGTEMTIGGLTVTTALAVIPSAE